MTAQKNYRVDSFVGGLAIKAPVRVASTANLTLSGEQTVNSVALVTGDRILVKDQTDTSENGIWEVEQSAWKRAADFDGNRDVVGGTLIPAYRVSGTTVEQWRVDGVPTPKTPGQPMTMTLYYDPTTAGIPEAPIDGSSYVRNNAGWVTEAASSLPSPSASSVLAGNGAGSNWVAASNIAINSTTGYLTLTSAALVSSDGVDDLNVITTNGVTSFTGSGGYNSCRFLPRVRFDSIVLIKEQAAGDAPIDAYGQFWTLNEVDNVPMFTSDTGTDQVIDPSRSDINEQNISYTTVLADKGKTIRKASGGSGETISIASEGTPDFINYKIGTLIAFDNDGGGNLTIDVNGTDILINATDGAIGSVSLANNGRAVAQKTASGQWKISGDQMT